MSGRRDEIFLAAPHLEQVEKLRFEPLGCGARPERAEINCRCAAQVLGDVAARKFVGQNYFDVGRHAQPQNFEIFLREVLPGQLIHAHGGFQLRSGEPVFDARDCVPQVQQP